MAALEGIDSGLRIRTVAAPQAGETPGWKFYRAIQLCFYCWTIAHTEQWFQIYVSHRITEYHNCVIT